MAQATASASSPLDRLGRALRDLRISVTDRCNFRCDYCMPREVFHAGHRFLPRHDILSFEEITRVARLSVLELGVGKLRLTGGEPLLRRGLPRLVELLAGIEPDAGRAIDLALTTNGQLLAEHAQALASAGLKRVTVSLDALDRPTFARMSGERGELSRVLLGIDAASRAGLAPIKLNCVVQRGINEHAVGELARYGREHGHIVRFIEFMDVGTLNAWRADAVVPAGEILQRIAAVAAIEPLSAVSSDGERTGEVAERYRYLDGRGEVGVISSITRPFCGQCTRARLSADGRLVTCLFAQSGPSLRQALRSGESDAGLAERLRAIWQQRDDRYSELRAEQDAAAPRRRLQMYEIGG
jgi:cyclic pyranopterin phosphate synthase